MATVREFVDFWLENCVHADEEFGPRRGRQAVEQLVHNLIRAADDQGITKAQIEAELGSPYDVIRARIDEKNRDEASRLKKGTSTA
ncbi:hypothetical protein [Bradyrhizobium sp. STM 3557]|uniref:hypothetical protein n=1 Tax=Bradyrhizobium sp. STM 3557 TaxID=578920 RepID=UPI0038903A53